MDINSRYFAEENLTRQGFKAPEHITLGAIMESSGVDLNIFMDRRLTIEDVPLMVKFNLKYFYRTKVKLDADRLLEYMFNYVPYIDGKTIGRGERMMCVCMKGDPHATNDFVVENARYEIKCNGRLRGEKGFSTTNCKPMRLHLQDAFNTDYGDNDKAYNFYNHRNKKRRFFLPDVCLELSSTWICKTYVDALAKYYTDMNQDERYMLMESLGEEFDDSGMIVPKTGQSVFVQKLAGFALKYYRRVEEFDYIVFLNKKLDCLVVPAAAIIDSTLLELAEFLNHEFTIVPPSLSDRAGRASAFSLKLK